MDRLRIFEVERDRLKRIATRVLGSPTDADDVLQEARLRLLRADSVDDLPAWLTTVVTRLCLDHLRKRENRTHFEAAVVLDASAIDPEAEALLAERVGNALQILLDTLIPAERVAFILHDTFGYQFDEISVVLGRSVTAVRQLASRARRKMQGIAVSSVEVSLHLENRRVVEAFLAAARGGDLQVLMSMLAPNAVMRSDAVGQSLGADRLYDDAAAIAARMNGAKGAAPMFIDGERGAAWIVAGTVKVAFVFHVEDSLISEIELIADPEVLTALTISRHDNTSTTQP